KGANVWATAGAAFRAGILSVRVEPFVELAQNGAFRLEPTPAGRSPYVDDLRPGTIDLPQRFGPSSVRVIDPGQSYIRLDWRGVAAGASSENLFWGPGVKESLLLDDNAAGFPHVFIGTSHLIHTPIGGFHGQLVYGRLTESDWAPTSVSTARLGAG